MWYAKRHCDGKEFLLTSLYTYKDSDIGGVNGVSEDSEKVELKDGTYEFYRK